MELTATNETIILAAADLIHLKGRARGQYYDKWQDCYCTLGAIRIQIFDAVVIFGIPSTDPRVKRYLEIVDWLAEKIAPGSSDMPNSESVVGMWNDASDKANIVRKLLEFGTLVAGQPD